MESSYKQKSSIDKHIRDRVREVRVAAGQTQQDTGDLLQKTRVAISDLERGRVSANAADLYLIAGYFKKPISFFFPAPSAGLQTLTPTQEEILSIIAGFPDDVQRFVLQYLLLLREHLPDLVAGTRNK